MLNKRRGGARPDRDRAQRLQMGARAAMEKSVRAGARAYERKRDLPGLIRIDPVAAGGESVADTEAIVALLRRALRGERNRARSGHWTYDLNRHIALHQAYLAESERLTALRASCR